LSSEAQNQSPPFITAPLLSGQALTVQVAGATVESA
jgi:hypothetical protein